MSGGRPCRARLALETVRKPSVGSAAASRARPRLRRRARRGRARSSRRASDGRRPLSSRRSSGHARRIRSSSFAAASADGGLPFADAAFDVVVCLQRAPARRGHAAPAVRGSPRAGAGRPARGRGPMARRLQERAGRAALLRAPPRSARAGAALLHARARSARLLRGLRVRARSRLRGGGRASAAARDAARAGAARLAR